MKLFGLTITRTKQTPAGLSSVPSRGGWFPVIREAFAGAWQRNLEYSAADVLTFAAVYACVTLIASDIGKIPIRLVERDEDGIWSEVTNPAYSPVLRKPNRFQTRIKFFEQWVVSKLTNGNTYILKQRDNRRIVTAMYVLDPTRVRPLVAPDGAVYYALSGDTLAGIPNGIPAIPASEIIHDVMVPLYHPLVGVTPITACGLAAMQGLRVQNNSEKFFRNGATPSGIVTGPEYISPEDADEYARRWEQNYGGNNYGRVAVLGSNLKYEQTTMTAVDAQLIEQLRWTAENVCMAFHVPPYMIGAAPAPAYNNIEALNQQYYSQTLQNPIESIELLLDEGLGINDPLGTELDLDALLRMDTATRVKTAGEAIKAGASPNEVRGRYLDLPPVAGGEVPFLQQQDWPINVLAKRDLAALTTPTPPSRAETAAGVDDEDEPDLDKRFEVALRKAAA